MKTLVGFADAHVAPGQDLRRFDWLGRLIADIKPDAIWNGGDLATCDSVSYFPVPFKEHTTLKDDVEIVLEAQARMFAPLDDLNRRRVMSKHGPHMPLRICTMGNHEDRLNRRIRDDERGLGSVINPHSLFGYEKYWDSVCEYKEYTEYEGILLTHAPINGLGKPISGAYRGRQIAMQSALSVLYGHTHKFDVSSVSLIGPLNLSRTAANLPCFMEQDHVESYAKKSATGWDYGLVIVKIFEPGKFTLNVMSMTELEHKYGDAK